MISKTNAELLKQEQQPIIQELYLLHKTVNPIAIIQGEPIYDTLTSQRINKLTKELDIIFDYYYNI